MPAYVIVEIRVNDPVRYEDYKKMAAPTIAAFGGRYLVRGGAVPTLEGALGIQRDWSCSSSPVRRAPRSGGVPQIMLQRSGCATRLRRREWSSSKACDDLRRGPERCAFCSRRETTKQAALGEKVAHSGDRGFGRDG